MTLRHTAGVMLCTLITLSSLSACAGTEDGNASPSGPSSPAGGLSSAPSTNDTGSAAPRVADPLDVSALRRDPCTALSAAQVEQLNLLPGEQDSTSARKSFCVYKYNDESGSSVSVRHEDKLVNGLSGVYERKNALGYFEPTQVSGYPAAYASPNDSRTDGICQLHVGLTDTFVVSVFSRLSTYTRDYPKGCEVTKITAEAMIKNLKGGS